MRPASDQPRFPAGLLAAALISATSCSGQPRCFATVVQGEGELALVGVYGGDASCAEVGSALTAALALLREPLPLLEVPQGATITFREGRYFPAADGTQLGGQSWCGPYEMMLGDGALRTPESSMAHELAHWGIGQEQQRTDCGEDDGEGGHRQWLPRGIYAALQRWDDGE